MPKGWEAPDGSRSVVFVDGVLTALCTRVVEALHSVPRRGAETGGLLFGRVLRQDPLLARITGFEEFPCAHRFGPSFILAEEEMAELDATLRGGASQERPDPVIGFFRSFTSREMVLDEVDRGLLSKYFPIAGPMLLLLQPHAAGDCTAAFLFPRESGAGWEPEYPAFDVARLSDLAASPAAAPGPPVAMEPPPAQPAATPAVAVAVPAAQLPLPHGRGSDQRRDRQRAVTDSTAEVPARRKRQFIVPLIAVVLLCIAAAAISVLWNMARAPHWAPLRLDAQVSSTGAIGLTWDGASAAARDASRGVLGIEDAAGSHTVALAPDQIRSGQYTYFPGAAGNNAGVLFRLEFFGATLGAAGDSLRVVARPQTVAAQQAKPQHREEAADRAVPRSAAEPHAANVAVQPEPLREIRPDIPPGIRARIADRVVIPVEVKVTPAGRVSSAAAKGTGDDLYAYLAGRSTQAARQWRFAPARTRAGKAVAAARTVYFVFTAPE
jgi:hypothetical protein